MADAQFSISWDAQKCFLSGLIDLQQKGDYVDMTLAADGHFVKVHQVVLALSSSYLGELIKTAQMKNNAHPILLLHNISFKTLSYLLEYIYTGEVGISIEHLEEFMEAGKNLLIRGLEKLENPLLTVQKSAQKDNTEKYHILQVGNPNEDIPEDDQEEDQDDVNMEHDDCKEIIPDIVGLEMPEDVKESDPLTSDTNAVPHPKLIKILPKPTMTPINKFTMPVIREISDDKQSIQGNIQYTISNKGSLQMIFNRFVYYAKYTAKSQRRQWRCVDYISNLKCPAYVVTKDEVILQRVSAHNHAFHDRKIMKKIKSGTVYKSIEQAPVT